SPTFVEVSESDVTEVPHMTDPLASAKFAMHAEVAAFQRQSERTELLRRQVAALDRKFETASTDFQRLAEEAAALAAYKLEASFRRALSSHAHPQQSLHVRASSPRAFPTGARTLT
ncbi:unnamed protein product, partial [Symbiodinium necroappetens]